LVWAMGDASIWLNFHLFKRLLFLSGLVLLGAISYFTVLYVLGLRPQDYIRQAKR
jgi:putative peptidoglycan lipid II flippase